MTPSDTLSDVVVEQARCEVLEVKSRPLQAAGELERRGEETALRLQVAQRCLKTQGSQAPRLLPLTIHSVLCQRTRRIALPVRGGVMGLSVT